jgi:hypothetical protein
MINFSPSVNEKSECLGAELAYVLPQESATKQLINAMYN